MNRRQRPPRARSLVETLESRLLLTGLTYQLNHWFGDADGGFPETPLVIDAQGNAFGATLFGGDHGQGTLFEIPAGGALTTLYSFSGGSDGGIPIGHMVLDGAGHLLGTAGAGGASKKGTIFSFDLGSSTLTVLHTFAGADGADPAGGLAQDANGNLFGTTLDGGSKNNGTIFKLASDHTFVTLHAFATNEGTNPYSGVAFDGEGALYGTTQANGPAGGGTVYRLSVTGTSSALTVLYASNKTSSLNGVIVDAQHNVYGTSEFGGTANAGMVFQINSGGAFHVLWNFSKADGYPWGDLLLDSNRNLYGTTLGGSIVAARVPGFGTVWEIPADNPTLTVLHEFNVTDGLHPSTGLTADANGNLFGVAQFGGPAGQGAVYELTTTPSTISVTKSIFQQSPDTGQAGRALNSFSVTLADNLNNVDPFSYANVTLAIQSGPAGATISGTKVVAAQNGVATFTNVILSKPGTYTLVASSGTLATSISTSFDVTAPATHLTFGTLPTSASAGANLGPFVVYVMDAANQIMANDSSLVTILSTANGSSLTGTLSVHAVNGVATFNDVHFNKATALVLQAKVKGLKSATSGPITLVPDVTTQQLILQQKPATNVKANAVLAPAIKVVLVDAFGNVFKDDHSSMTISISSGPNGGVISKGTTTVTASGGKVTFGNLVLSTAGSYMLQIVDAALNLNLTFTQNVI